MSESAHAPSISRVPATQNSPLRQTYARDEPRHLNKEFDHGCHRNATIVTPGQFSVLEYRLCYTSFFEAGRFRGISTDGNELQEQDRLEEHRNTGAAGWPRHWNHWGSCSALSCRCIGKERNSLSYALEEK